MTTCKCGKPAEWLDQYCQTCWEGLCADSWWTMIAAIENPVARQSQINKVKRLDSASSTK